jgi:hypothetical protein
MKLKKKENRDVLVDQWHNRKLLSPRRFDNPILHLYVTILVSVS